jgi:hypothetical protein
MDQPSVTFSTCEHVIRRGIKISLQSADLLIHPFSRKKRRIGWAFGQVLPKV